jgi:hypothetical protein
LAEDEESPRLLLILLQAKISKLAKKKYTHLYFINASYSFNIAKFISTCRIQAFQAARQP